MFCSNCGNQIPDGMKFCSFCGTPQVTAPSGNTTANAPSGNPTPSPVRNRPQKKAKKTNIWLILVVVLGASLLGKFVIAPSMMSDSGQSGPSNSQGDQYQKSASWADDVANPDYEAIFDGTYILHINSFFNMETTNFAMKQADGTICCSDYGHKDDVVNQWVETVYIPVSQYSDSEKAQLESAMKSQYAALEELSCCTASYNMSANYFSMKFTYSDVDKPAACSELYDAGILQTNTFISMSATEDLLLAEGFIKK